MSLKEKNIDRVSLWMIGMMIMFVVVGGILQFRSYLTAYQRAILSDYQYFSEKVQQQVENGGILSSGDASLESLQKTDTDADTLSDFDELYLYNTSPYLADTDSDGTADPEEIKAGTSPTCAQGTECGTTPQADASTTVAAAIPEFIVPEGFIPSDDPSVLRKQLVDIGIPQELLDQVDDISLQEFIASEGGGNNVTDEQLLSATMDTLQQMSMQEKRDFLIASGASQDQVDVLSDAQIETLFTDAIAAVAAERKQEANTTTQAQENSDTTTNDEE